MSTFACHCGGIVTGTSDPDPERDDNPTWTFACNDHRGAGPRELLIVRVSGTPTGERALALTEEDRMAVMKDAIDVNGQWLLDNPTTPLTSDVIL